MLQAEVMRVFRNPETFDELLLGFVEADEVSWLASHLPDMPLSARSPVRQQVVQWIVAAFKTQLPRVDPDLVVMAVLLGEACTESLSRCIADPCTQSLGARSCFFSAACVTTLIAQLVLAVLTHFPPQPASCSVDRPGAEEPDAPNHHTHSAHGASRPVGV